MESQYEFNAKILKALSDPNRLKILKILYCGDMGACEILKYFKFTQPTLSHHLKVLIDCGLVESRKNGIWNYYNLNLINLNELLLFLVNTFNDTN